ncbi:hypothetical protein BC567DRAFT_222859 [Phyllosticta citribraziliensis]
MPPSENYQPALTTASRSSTTPISAARKMYSHRSRFRSKPRPALKWSQLGVSNSPPKKAAKTSPEASKRSRASCS